MTNETRLALGQEPVMQKIYTLPGRGPTPMFAESDRILGGHVRHGYYPSQVGAGQATATGTKRKKQQKGGKKHHARSQATQTILPGECRAVRMEECLPAIKPGRAVLLDDPADLDAVVEAMGAASLSPQGCSGDAKDDPEHDPSQQQESDPVAVAKAKKISKLLRKYHTSRQSHFLRDALRAKYGLVPEGKRSNLSLPLVRNRVDNLVSGLHPCRELPLSRLWKALCGSTHNRISLQVALRDYIGSLHHLTQPITELDNVVVVFGRDGQFAYETV